jgi:NDP-sugar pyrophosphorylase family protein
MKAVIQAGGLGTRLKPYTMILPKPLMPIGNQPVLELLLKWLRRNGTRDAYITTGHLGHLIGAVCGDGSQWDMRIKYTRETLPLGTVGALTLLRDDLDRTFLMLNGDVLTDLDLNAFGMFHRQHGGLLSIAVARRRIRIDFGIIEEQDGNVIGFREKPSLYHTVSMGIYCMEPEIIDFIPRGVAFGFDDLMFCLLGKSVDIHCYVHEGLWLDIGRVEDFQAAQETDFEEYSPALRLSAA